MLALVFMLMLAIVSTAVMQTGALQFHMAGNDQFQEEALQQAQAIATELARHPDNFSLTEGVGFTNCFSVKQSPGCDSYSLVGPLPTVLAQGIDLDYRVIRQDPYLLKGLSLRNAELPGGEIFDAGIFEIVDELVQAGANRERLVAKVAGGANMFESSYQTLIKSIGARNARSARKTLASLGIPILGEEVGGNRGRTVEFDLATGNMMVYCARDDDQVSI